MPRNELYRRLLMAPPWSGARQPWRGCRIGLWLLTLATARPLTAEDIEHATPAEPFDVVLVRGHVVWYAEALQRRLGIGTVPEAADRVLALETDEGQLVPLIEDLRTRAFRKDDRLRQMHVQLRLRRYRTTPSVQILTVFELQDGVKYEVDYWCDICSIPMYETGPCACCQQDNRLRKRQVDAAAGVP
jgi:hypothetical protein